MCLLTLLTVWTSSPEAASALPNSPEALVRSLYKQVVARHPLGVPYGEDKTVFAPYLSKTLLHRFDLNNACGADWHRQYPDPNLKPPGVFEDGIFSGSSEQAEPKAFSIGRTEVESDGVSRVHVKLTWEDASNAPMTWYVAAVVGRENGRPVVEDVLFLKDDDRKIEARLSKMLASGCDGPRWVGDGAK